MRVKEARSSARKVLARRLERVIEDAARGSCWPAETEANVALGQLDRRGLVIVSRASLEYLEREAERLREWRRSARP
jgi:hypothetical protein